MIVQHAARWLYIGPPKTGSTTLHTELQRPRFGGAMAQPGVQHDVLPPKGCEDYFKFATVRSPYHRATSLYWHFLTDIRAAEAEASKVSPAYNMPFRTDLYSFEQFMELMISDRLPFEPLRNAFFRNTLTWWLRAVKLDAIIRLENLEDAFKALPIWHDKDNTPNFGRYNSVGTPGWRFMMNPTVIHLVEIWAGEDFEKFGYAKLAGAFRGPLTC